MRVPIERSAKLAEMQAYRAELEALTPDPLPPPTFDPDWYLHVPSGLLVYINALAGEVYCAVGSPARRWLADMDADARAATDE